MLVKPPTSTLKNELALLSAYDVAMLSSGNQTNFDTLFPDEEHAYEPRRQVRLAALSRTGLPFAALTQQRRRQSNSPVKRQNFSPQQSSSIPIPTCTSPAVQAFRKKYVNNIFPKSLDKELVKKQGLEHRKREIDIDSSELCGFPVHYSPKEQLDTQWRAIIEQNQRYFDAKQEQESNQQNIVLHEQQESRAHEADYAQYLYLSTLYGPLDALLYCCCRPGSHGRVYMLLVDTSARRIQRWSLKRIATLRRYWVGHLAREVSTISLAEGLEFVVYSFQHQRRATALFYRLRLLRAARILRAWLEYTTRMSQLRDKIRLALAKDVAFRFFQWRAKVHTRTNFRLNLKYIARHKAIQYSLKNGKIGVLNKLNYAVISCKAD